MSQANLWLKKGLEEPSSEIVLPCHPEVLKSTIEPTSPSMSGHSEFTSLISDASTPTSAEKPLPDGGGGQSSGSSSDIRSSWSVDDVVSVLNQAGLGQYSAAFRSEHVDGILLISLDDQDLIELGVSSSLHRKRIQNIHSKFSPLQVAPPVGYSSSSSSSSSPTPLPPPNFPPPPIPTLKVQTKYSSI
jgi:hypothetical protein